MSLIQTYFEHVFNIIDMRFKQKTDLTDHQISKFGKMEANLFEFLFIHQKEKQIKG